MFDESEDIRSYNVVINHEEQYSIWFSDRELPLGWKIVEIPTEWLEKNSERYSSTPVGNKQQCLDYIEDVWVDMRPLSLREHMKNNAMENAC